MFKKLYEIDSINKMVIYLVEILTRRFFKIMMVKCCFQAPFKASGMCVFVIVAS